MPKLTAKVFETGNGQVMLLPTEFRLNVDEVFIEQDGDKVVLSPRPTSWDVFFSSQVRPTDDFMEQCTDTMPQAHNDM